MLHQLANMMCYKSEMMLGALDLNWEEVKCFAVVAEAGTVRRAARRLGVHHSTVSRRIDNLEHALGTKLFDRKPEGYVLNTAGEELVTTVHQCGILLNDAERRVTGQDRDLSGSVTVTMAGPLATHVFGPKLAKFANAYPNIELHIITTTAVLDISRRDADVAIRIDNNPPESLIGKRLFPYYQTIYATQEYLNSQDFKNEPETARWISWRKSENRFPEWTKDTEFGKVPLWGYFPEPSLQQSAARGGLGLAMLPCIVGDNDTHLVRASTRKPIKARDIWLLTHEDLRRTTRIKAFMAFAEKTIREAKDELMGIR